MEEEQFEWDQAHEDRRSPSASGLADMPAVGVSNELGTDDESLDQASITNFGVSNPAVQRQPWSFANHNIHRSESSHTGPA